METEILNLMRKIGHGEHCPTSYDQNRLKEFKIKFDEVMVAMRDLKKYTGKDLDNAIYQIERWYEIYGTTGTKTT